MTTMTLQQLRRIRWGVRSVLILGIVASVVANVLHARDNPISQSIAAWPPLALLLTVELISRVPVHKRSLAFARIIATAAIAGIAAWVSYWHMAGVAGRYGESTGSAHLMPLSVDGLVVVASICLVELGARIGAVIQPEVNQPAALAEPPKPRPLPSPVPLFQPPPGDSDQGDDDVVIHPSDSDDPAGQPPIQDTRSPEQVEAAVRSMRQVFPDMAIRQIATAIQIPYIRAYRILQRADEAPVNGHNVLEDMSTN